MAAFISFQISDTHLHNTQPVCSAERAAIHSTFHRHTGEFCSLLPVTVFGHCTRTRETNTQTPPRRLSLMVLHQEQATCDSRHGCRYLHSCQSHGSITALICFDALAPASSVWPCKQTHHTRWKGNK